MPDAIFLCTGSRTECWNCGGHTHSLDPDTGQPGPFEGDSRYCSEDCYAESGERERIQAEQSLLRYALCPDCGFDNQEHDEGCIAACAERPGEPEQNGREGGAS